MALDRLPFLWHSVDLRAELPENWQIEILSVAERLTKERTLVPTSITSREATDSARILVQTVGGTAVSAELPWLYALYLTRFRDLAQRLTSEPVSTADDLRYGINLNVQRGPGMRYECHVDSNPIQGMLYVTEHLPGSGGELIVSNLGDVTGKASVDLDATRIYPVAGYLVLFDARKHTHYVADVNNSSDLRVAAAMNFYTPKAPESARPPDLNRHLFGSD